MPDEVIWLTYDGLAERLGIEKESARQRARRGLWARRKDNLGRITVAVPADLLESQTEALRDTPTDALQEAAENRYLNRYVEKIEQALEVAQERAEALERERDEARDEAVTAEKAQAAVAAQ